MVVEVRSADMVVDAADRAGQPCHLVREVGCCVGGVQLQGRPLELESEGVVVYW